MLLSNTDHPFSQSTLIVRADHAQAELWFGSELELNLVAQVGRPEHVEKDHGSAAYGEKHSDEAGREYLVLLEKAIAAQVAAHQVESVWFVMEADLLHRVHEALSPDVKKHVTHGLSRDLMKEDVLALVARMREDGTKMN